MQSHQPAQLEEAMFSIGHIKRIRHLTLALIIFADSLEEKVRGRLHYASL